MSDRGLRRGTWSPFELQRLRQLFANGGVAHAAGQLRRSPAATRRKLEELLERKLVRGRWSDREIDQLRESWGALEMGELRLLLARSERDIRRQAAGLRARRTGPWSSRERVQLKRWYGTRTPDALEVCLSRPTEEIEIEAQNLRLGVDRRRGPERPGRMARWQPEEVELLRQLYATSGTIEVARRLGRTVQGVANKASQLGLRKHGELLSEVGRRNVGHRHGKS